MRKIHPLRIAFAAAALIVSGNFLAQAAAQQIMGCEIDTNQPPTADSMMRQFVTFEGYTQCLAGFKPR